MASLQIDDTLFWNLVAYLEKLNKKVKLNHVSKDLEVGDKKIIQGIYYLQQLGHPIKIDYHNKDGPLIIPPENKTKIEISFNLTEWIALQAYFPILQKEERPYQDTIIKKLAEIEEKYPDFQLLNGEMPWPKVSQDKIQVLGQITSIEEKVKQAIDKKIALTIKLNGREELIKIIPYEIEVLLAGPILIGENEYGDLMEVSILEISNINFLNERITSKLKHKNLSKKITEIRLKNEKSIRAILKIFSFQKFNTYHRPSKIENPFVTLNGEGEIIWAATTTIDNEFLEWINQLSPEVEIVSPDKLSTAYSQFLKERLKKVV